MPSLYRHLFSSKTPTKSPSPCYSSQRLEKVLASARRAEAPPDKRNHQEYARLIHATHGNDIADGIFVCCCGAENDLVHFQGDYSLKHVKCRACNYTYCKKCTSSEILEPINVACLALNSTRQHSSLKGRIERICPDCGLTHRDGSVNLATTCPCGARPSIDWVSLYIGTTNNYRHDPNAAAVHLKIGRAMRTVERLAQSQPVPMKPKMVQLKPGPPQRRNAVRGRGPTRLCSPAAK